MFVISEISPQFSDDITLAEQYIMQSKMAGANAVKVQLYPKGMFDIPGIPGSRDYLALSKENFLHLVAFGKKMSIPVFASVFEESRLDWCIEAGQEYYKVAARQHKESPDLVSKILALNKPTFVSVPATDEAPKELIGKENIILLSCTLKYPTLLEEVSIPDFKSGVYEGISDHSIGSAAAIYAAAHGSKYLEKHFTLSIGLQKSTEGAHVGAMTFDDLKLIKQISTEFKLIKG